MNVYKVLAEAPDPYPLLEAAVVRSIMVETSVIYPYRGLGPNREGC